MDTYYRTLFRLNSPGHHVETVENCGPVSKQRKCIEQTSITKRSDLVKCGSRTWLGEVVHTKTEIGFAQSMKELFLKVTSLFPSDLIDLAVLQTISPTYFIESFFSNNPTR